MMNVLVQTAEVVQMTKFCGWEESWLRKNVLQSPSLHPTLFLSLHPAPPSPVELYQIMESFMY